MRVAVRGAAPPRLDIPAWTNAKDNQGNQISFYSQAPLAMTAPGRHNLVLAIGAISRPGQPANQPYLIAFSRCNGDVEWLRAIPALGLESFSGVSVDPLHDTAIVCSGNSVTALDLSDGELRWQRSLTNQIVNAMPAFTTDLGQANRLFITDYDGFGTSAKLYAINTDPFNASLNPYQPGAIVWSAPIGTSGGNSPAYLPACQGGLGMVYVATPGPGGRYVAGLVRAFQAATNTPVLVWQASNTQLSGFWGPVALAPPDAPGTPPRVYAASYEFNVGGQQSSNLVSLNGATGDLVWTVPCNRTSTAPIPLPDRRVVLSTGIDFSDAYDQPSVQLFVETTNESQRMATMAWDTALSTWDDLNGDGLLEPGEYFSIGGWNEQPALLTASGRNLLAVGVLTPGANTNTPSSGLYLLDLDQSPASPGFVYASSDVTAAGGSVALGATSLASIGLNGLTMFGATPGDLDVNSDNARTIDDLYSWESGAGHRDVDGDQVVSGADRAVLIRAIRPTWPGLRQGVLP